MPKFDNPTKRLMQTRTHDWIRLVYPNCREEWIQPLETEIRPTEKSQLDGVYRIDDGEKIIYMDLEPQAYLDLALPIRMLRYRADIWAYARAKKEEMPTIKQAVVYYYPNHDIKNHQLHDDAGGDSKIQFSYDVIRLWEVPKAVVIENQLIGLYPLMVFMKEEPGETPEEIMQLTVNTIETLESQALKTELYAATTVFASEKFTIAFVKKFIRRETIMESALLKELFEEEREKITKEMERKIYEHEKIAAIEKATEDIIVLIKEKYDWASKPIKDKVRKIEDLETLDELLKKIIRTETLEEYEKLIDKALSTQIQS